MNLLENIKEGLRSVKANLLRSVLTALIVALGITALVGMLTAIDGIEASVSDSMANLGVNSFDIYTHRNRGGRQGGIQEKSYATLQLKEAQQFVARFAVPSNISLSAKLSWTAEARHLSKKSNPNILVIGVNTDYANLKGLALDKGRNFSSREIQFGSRVCIIGMKVYDAIYTENEEALGTEISVFGTQLRVIGVLKEKGALSEDNYDNMVQIPVLVANQLAEGRGLDYYLTIGVNDVTQIDAAMGEATGLMRNIRHDRVGYPNSFEIEKSDTLAENLESITSGLRIGGFAVGFITLLGASIALMNIMLVSVTERTREVGVRKALGATPLRIRQQFVIEAIVVCVLGGIAGIILGTAVGNLFARLMAIKEFILPWVWMIFGLVVCVVVGLMSGYYPAWKASKLDPIESLRFE